MKRIFALLFAGIILSTMTASAADAAKINGWISDSMCGAKHTGTGADCVKKCIQQMHAAPVFVDETKKAVWAIDNPDAVKDYYGGHVTIVATTDAAKKSVHIQSITATK